MRHAVRVLRRRGPRVLPCLQRVMMLAPSMAPSAASLHSSRVNSMDVGATGRSNLDPPQSQQPVGGFKPGQHQRVEPITYSQSPASVVSKVMLDHEAIRGLIAEFNDDSKSVEEKQQVAYSMTQAIAVHSHVEENVVYPAFSKYVNGGRGIEQQSMAEHQEVKEALYQIDNMRANDPNYLPTMWKMQESLLRHMETEEDSNLPSLAHSVNPDVLRELGAQYESAKSIAPTRPHPMAPTQGVVGTVVQAMTKPIDKARDALRSATDAVAPGASTDVLGPSARSMARDVKNAVTGQSSGEGSRLSEEAAALKQRVMSKLRAKMKNIEGPDTDAAEVPTGPSASGVNLGDRSRTPEFAERK